MDKYQHYNHLELADDPSFIKWAKGRKNEDVFDWDMWLANNPDKQETVNNAIQIVKSIKFKEEKVSKSMQDAVWAKINTDIQSTVKKSIESTIEKPQKSKIIRMLSYGAVAAVALLLIMMNIGSEFDTTITTPYAAIESITLPDGSIVQMNADSKLEYNKEKWNEDRTLTLKGEAFFSVEKGSKFTVKTEHGDISVLGTSFNINTRYNKLNVICKTGKVAVKTSNKETILTPNQAVNISGGTHKKIDDLASNIDRSKWTNGTYTYNGALLSHVISDIERLYNVKITIDQTTTKTKYSGGFSVGNLETSLSEVLWPLGLTFEINQKNVMITEK